MYMNRVGHYIDHLLGGLHAMLYMGDFWSPETLAILFM